MAVLARYGIKVAPIDDTMLLAFTLEGGLHKSYGMDHLAKLILDHEPIAYKSVAGTGKSQVSFKHVKLAAATAYARQPSYIARLKRREWANGKPKPEETLIFKFRERPYSVGFKWLSDEGKGRHVVYVRGQGDDKLHVLTVPDTDRAFYSKGTYDIEYDFPFGRQELLGHGRIRVRRS